MLVGEGSRTEALANPECTASSARDVWEMEGMIDREWKPIFLAAIAVALLVAAALGYAPGDAFVVERAVAANEGSDPAEIRIAKGRLSGKFNNRPLFEVLDAIRSQAGFEYQGDKKTLSHPVSGEFERLPLDVSPPPPP